jgi:hypothetical protein
LEPVDETGYIITLLSNGCQQGDNLGIDDSLCTDSAVFSNIYSQRHETDDWVRAGL